MLQVPCAADVVLAGLLDAQPLAARVIAVTPLAAYAARGDLLVGLVAPGAVRVPGSFVVPSRLLAVLRPEEEVVIGGGGVVVAGARLTVRRWWDSTVPRVRRPRPPDVVAVPAGVPDDVRDGALALQHALTERAAVPDAVRGLVGLGPGLTPAGDDVLAAVLVTLVAAGDVERARAVHGAVQPCRHRTTVLSAALLDHAAAGRAVPQLARYLHAPADPYALEALLAVGGTSGAALALGAGTGLSAMAARMASPADREVA